MAEITQVKKLSDFPAVIAKALRAGAFVPAVMDDGEGTGALENVNIPVSSFIRAQLEADRTYFIDSVNGNDDNDGLSSVTAFQSWEWFLYIVYNTINFANFNLQVVALNLANGTYVLDRAQLMNIGTITATGFINGKTFRLINSSATYGFSPVQPLGEVSGTITVDAGVEQPIKTMSINVATVINLNFPTMDIWSSHTIELHIEVGAIIPAIDFQATAGIRWIGAEIPMMDANRVNVIVFRAQGVGLVIGSFGGSY